LSKPTKPNANQGNFLFADLLDQLNPEHPCCNYQDKLTGLFLMKNFHRSIRPWASHQSTSV